ncbi:uncharacterized protein LOC102679964 isoform X2 [Apis dorsata]|uniref:uncharacterized protein LOC102679964 isoform X2 n=1 Tax=Apis dorsata TaxID=7462 RepID=UPI0003DF7672|nr:uncharacterized protein LOC102679964 isoform X2 [Apis dorsata]
MERSKITTELPCGYILRSTPLDTTIQLIIVVVPKRAALLFDRLMVALQKVVDNQNKGELDGSRPFVRSPHLSIENSQIIPSTDEQTMKMDLQRRGQAKGRVYWRCYFNAVTCFKRK